MIVATLLHAHTRPFSKLDSSEYSNYGKDSLSILLHQYGLPRTALSLDGEKFQKQALVTHEVYAEWTIFHHYIPKQPKEGMSSPLYDLSTNETLKPMFPNLHMYLGQCLYVISKLGQHQWREAFQK